MTPPMRPILFSLTERGEIKTLRDAVEWYKKVYKGTEPLGDLTKLELNYVNGQWGEVIKELSEAQGVPGGMLSYWLDELARTEVQLTRAAQDESEAAQQYGG